MLKNLIFCIIIITSICVPTHCHAQAEQRIFTVGEKHTYKIRWLGMNVGELTVETIREDIYNARPVYVIVLSGSTNKICSCIYRIRDRFVSYIDKEKLVPLRLEVSRREGFYKKDALTIFDHTQKTAYFENFLDGSKKTYPIPENVQDIISVFYRMRTQNITLEQFMCFDVMFAETVFTAFGTAQKKVSITINGKVLSAYYTEPHAKIGTTDVTDGTVEAYFSPDKSYIPLRFEIKAPIFTKITCTLSDTSL